MFNAADGYERYMGRWSRLLAPGYLAFAESGFSRKIEALGERFAGVVMCDSRGNTAVDGGDRSAARGVTVSTTGRPRVTRSRAEILDAGPTMNLGGCP